MTQKMHQKQCTTRPGAARRGAEPRGARRPVAGCFAPRKLVLKRQWKQCEFIQKSVKTTKINISVKIASVNLSKNQCKQCKSIQKAVKTTLLLYNLNVKKLFFFYYVSKWFKWCKKIYIVIILWFLDGFTLFRWHI